MRAGTEPFYPRIRMTAKAGDAVTGPHAAAKTRSARFPRSFIFIVRLSRMKKFPVNAKGLRS